MIAEGFAGRVFTTTLDGKLVHTLMPPDGTKDLGDPVANDYFMGRGGFIPTDVEQLDGTFYIATGYSNLDFILSARILSTNPFRTEWHDIAFGGRGRKTFRRRLEQGLEDRLVEPNGPVVLRYNVAFANLRNVVFHNI